MLYMNLFTSRLKKISILLAAVCLTACAQVKDIAYFQNRVDDHPEKIDMHAGIVIQPKDMISIVVSSRNPELVPMFNLPVISYQAGSEIVNSGQQRLLGYVVDNDGCIDFPVLGRLEVGGMTRWQLSEMIKDRLMQVPGIEGVTFSENIPTRKFYGMQLVDPGSGETVATCRYAFVDTDFIRTLGIALTEGSDIPGEMSDPSPALVNRRLTDALGWDGSPTGRVLPQNGIVVSGVIGDFTMQSIFLEQDPVCLLPLPEGFRRLYLTIRFSEITPEALSGAESLLRRLSPENDIILRTYRDDIHESYRDTEHFRNSVLAAAAFMLLIVLAGLVGFVSDEMRRRRKENALRRVNGASAADIQTMMLRNIGKICIPAVLAGLMLAAIAAFRWLQHFPEKIRPHFLLFLATGLVLAAVILACVSLCTFKAAAGNPARHLRSE